MKKKLTRKDFAGLRQSYPVLSKEEMRRYVAGRSTFYDENDWFLSNPYAMDMDMNMDMGMPVRNEKGSDEADGQFPSDMDVSVFSASSYGNGSGDDWFYHGFGGYDPDGNYHWYSGYTQEELENWEGTWYGGWVYGMGYVGGEGTVYGHYSYGGDDFWDDWGDSYWGDFGYGYPGFYFDVGYYGYDYDWEPPKHAGGGGGGSGTSTGGSSSSSSDSSTSITDDLKDLLVDITKSVITESAEVAHEVFMEVLSFVSKYPEEVEAVKDTLDGVIKKVEPYLESDPNKMGWGDLFFIWLFELDKSNMKKETDDNGNVIYVFHFEGNAKTTKDLQTQEGVLQAREKALAQLRENDLSTINHSWSYDVPEFVDGMQERNWVTSFLGSYNTEVKITDNQDGTYTLNYKVKNTSGWESATRLRVAHDKSYHDGIIPNCDRDTGIGLGGTITEEWVWSETVKID